MGYDLYEIENGQPVRIATYGAGTTSATVAGLAAGTKYAFNLVAFNNAGTAATPWLAVSTLAGSVGLSPPAPPGKFAGAAITTTQIRLNWTISPTAIGYDLYEIINGKPARIANYAVNLMSATVLNLSPGTTYSFNLVAYNKAGTAATPWIQVKTLGMAASQQSASAPAASVASATTAALSVAAATKPPASASVATDAVFAQMVAAGRRSGWVA